MQDFAQESLKRRDWALHLLLLDKSDQRGLLGVMFDDTQVLPRQGAAVFAGEIRGIDGIDHDRKLIQTSVHELGHALNLAHRFERVVGRADSSSFMNYDWRYGGGDKRDEFWERFSYSFDPDELSFLRHGVRPAVIPGGAAFHSVRYWNEGTGGYSPYVTEAPLEGFALELKPARRRRAVRVRAADLPRGQPAEPDRQPDRPAARAARPQERRAGDPDPQDGRQVDARRSPRSTRSSRSSSAASTSTRRRARRCPTRAASPTTST